MNGADLLVLGLLAVIVFLAVRSIVRQKKNGGGCSGLCSTCMQKCSAADNSSRPEELLRKKREARNSGER